MPPKRRPARKPRRKTTTKPYMKRKSAPKTTLAAFSKMLAKTSEKKRYYIAPVALTNGDITCVAPTNAYRDGGTSSGLFQPTAFGQQASISTMGVGLTTVGGWLAFDITPHPIENNGFSGREGSQIVLNSTYAQFKFTQQSGNTLTPIRIRMVILDVQGAPQDSKAVMEAFYLNSALPNGNGIGNNNGLIDFNSNISPDQRSQYKVIYNKTTTLFQDSVDAGLMVKNHVIKLKYNRGKGHKIRFIQNSTTLAHGQLVMLITADAGNLGAVAYSGPGNGTLVNNAANSGAALNFNICHYFTDP